MITNAVIKKISLPIHGAFSSDISLPIRDQHFHSRPARERKNRV
jgi:hypothetical protein